MKIQMKDPTDFQGRNPTYIFLAGYCGKMISLRIFDCSLLTDVTLAGDTELPPLPFLRNSAAA